MLICPISIADYVAGVPFKVYSINACQGPVKIKVVPEKELKENEIKIEKCRYVNDDMWTCTCQNQFDVNVLTIEKTKNTYDFVIQYYTKYYEINETGNGTPSLSEIKRDNYLEVQKINDVNVISKQKRNLIFDINIDIRNAVTFALSLFIFFLSIGIFIFKKRFRGKTHNKNNDVLNYMK